LFFHIFLRVYSSRILLYSKENAKKSQAVAP
jgi:hypothetical protein